ncbi:hypothetical protein C8R43DRAFT_941765 [Mycena crocata]|nr:hypothetical protein C8R43DRAFT_941765 [Mycena crocata]
MASGAHAALMCMQVSMRQASVLSGCDVGSGDKERKCQQSSVTETRTSTFVSARNSNRQKLLSPGTGFARHGTERDAMVAKEAAGEYQATWWQKEWQLTATNAVRSLKLC